MSASRLSPHVEACVRSQDLARVVAEVLGRVPRAVEADGHVRDLASLGDLATPLVVPLDAMGLSLPASLLPGAASGRWSRHVPIVTGEGSREVRVCTVPPREARELAAQRDRHAAVMLASDPPAGCVWALYLDGKRAAVLCLRPTPSNNTPTMAGVA